MNEYTVWAIAAVAFFAFLAIGTIYEQRPKDVLAERIQAIDKASFGMSDEARERLMAEVLKGNTNSVEVMLEKK